jgi:hypothetical protein
MYRRVPRRWLDHLENCWPSDGTSLPTYAKAEMQELEIPTAQQLSKTELGPVELLAREGTEKVSLGEAPLLTKNYDTMVTLN